MNVREYFETLGQEIAALKHRVRHLIADAHWQTDGEWKETVVRHVLRRHLPATAVVGRGFVVSGQTQTRQIDILVHDASKPVLFRDGDLAFVTPDAVLGILEVKARVNDTILRQAAGTIAANAQLIRSHPNTRAFSGIFAFDLDGRARPQRLVDILSEAAPTYDERLDFACLGASTFLRYWNEDPETGRHVYKSWHAYNVPDLAAGYFVHNVVDAVSPESVFRNREVWFPRPGKEPFRTAAATARWA